MNTRIYAAEKSFDIGCRVVKWDEPNGFDFHPKGNYVKRNIPFKELSNKLKQFTIHWSETYRASHMFSGLNARGLSCNFMIDDDNTNGFATIYQCLNLLHGGWSQGGVYNSLGPGVELSYMASAWEKDRYTLANRVKWKVPSHATTTATVHGTRLKVHLPTEAQLNSLAQLMWGFVELFPIPAKFPRTSQGFPVLTTLKDAAQFSGFVNHYHLKREKIDAAGIDMERLEKEVEIRHTLGF